MKLFLALFVIAFMSAWHGTTASLLQDVADVIKEDWEIYRMGTKGTSEMNSCTITATEPCDISSLPKGVSSMVYVTPPADILDTSTPQCIFGQPYAFQVIPGDSDKLMFYWQGGGACWDAVTTLSGMCTTTANPNSPTGIFDTTNAANPYASYTIVHALYCSGDVWGGNVVAPYTHKESPVVQVGAVNAQFTIDWVSRQVSLGSISATLSSFIGMGCSAGSVGVQLWSDVLLSTFGKSAQQAAIVPDSYAGVFPPNSIGPLIKEFGICSNTAILPASLVDQCNAGQLDIQDVMQVHIAKYPQFPFAYVQSKIDAVQQSFYIMLGLTTKNSSAIITPSKFYNGVNTIFSKYNALPNFITYLVDGPMHCFTPMDIMYQTTSYGPFGKRHMIKDPLQTSLTKWLSKLPMQTNSKINTECVGEVEGSVLPNDSAYADDKAGHGSGKFKEWFKTFVAGFNEKTKYCASSILPKTYQQSEFDGNDDKSI